MFFDDEVYKSVLESLATGVYLVDRAGKILFWNDGAETITGYLRQEVIGRSCHDNLLMPCDETNAVLTGTECPLAGVMLDGNRRMLELSILHKDGQRVPVRAHCFPVRNEIGAIAGAAASFDELVLRPGADSYPSCRVFRDSVDNLTGVLDGSSLEAHLDAALEDLRDNRVPFGVLCMSIDQLTEFRRHHGTIAAQATLRVTAQTLQKSIGPLDVIGRRGEDLFFAVVTGCPAAHLESVATKFQRFVGRASVRWWGDQLSISISVGGTASRAEDTVAGLLERSQNALVAVNACDSRVTIR